MCTPLRRSFFRLQRLHLSNFRYFFLISLCYFFVSSYQMCKILVENVYIYMHVWIYMYIHRSFTYVYRFFFFNRIDKLSTYLRPNSTCTVSTFTRQTVNYHIRLVTWIACRVIFLLYSFNFYIGKIYLSFFSSYFLSYFGAKIENNFLSSEHTLYIRVRWKCIIFVH